MAALRGGGACMWCRGLISSLLVAGFTGCGVIFYLLDLIFKAVGSTRWGTTAPMFPFVCPISNTSMRLWRWLMSVLSLAPCPSLYACCGPAGLMGGYIEPADYNSLAQASSMLGAAHCDGQPPAA